MSTNQVPDVPYASQSEVRAALENISPADAVRLKQLAKLRASGTHLEWSDLLHEAFSRTLSGQRQWPVGVPLVAYLAQTMRSISYDERSELGMYVPLDEVTSSRRGPLTDPGRTDLTPDRFLAARQQLAQVHAIFADDPTALAVLVALAEEQAPTVTQGQLKLSATQYASTLRRIRRRLHAFELGDQRS